MASPRFIRGLQVYLDHWLEKTADLDDPTVHQLNPDFPGLLKIVELGLVLPETQEKTAELILQCFFWAEQVGYVSVWQPMVLLAVQRISTQSVHLRFRLLKQLGQLQRLQYQLDEAIATFRQAEQLAHSMKDEQAIAEIFMNLCQVYHVKGMYQEAEEYGCLALDGLPNDQHRLRAITLRTMGIMAHEQGFLQQAEEYLQTSLKLSNSLKEQALTSNVLAIVFQQQEQYDQALITYNGLLALLDRVTNFSLFVDILLNKGSLLYSLDCLGEAEVVFKEAENLLRHRSGVVFQKAWVANNLGCILREQKQFSMAEANFRLSIQQFAQVGSEIYEANAWGNLGKLYAQQGQELKAVSCYDKVLKLVASYSDNAFARELKDNYTSLRNER